MKKAVFALALILGAFAANAQTKVAHLNTSELIQQMPEADSIQKKLLKVQSQWEMMLKEKETELQTKYEALVKLSKDPTVSKEILEIRQREIESLQESYQATRQQADTDLQQKQEEYLQPLLDKVRKAIEEVAKTKGYDYVFDSTEGSNLLYSNPTHDLMQAVKLKLGLL